jgi:hypothetical protein
MSSEKLAYGTCEVEAMPTGFQRGCHMPIGVQAKEENGGLQELFLNSGSTHSR